jgi:hypothetical protein
MYVRQATAEAASKLGMTGYIHWDWLGDFKIGIGTNGTSALPFLEDAAKSTLELALVASVPDIIKPTLPDVIGGRLAVVKPTSALVDGIGQWESDDANAPKGCHCAPPGSPQVRKMPSWPRIWANFSLL